MDVIFFRFRHNTAIHQRAADHGQCGLTNIPQHSCTCHGPEVVLSNIIRAGAKAVDVHPNAGAQNVIMDHIRNFVAFQNGKAVPEIVLGNGQVPGHCFVSTRLLAAPVLASWIHEDNANAVATGDFQQTGFPGKACQLLEGKFPVRENGQRRAGEAIVDEIGLQITGRHIQKGLETAQFKFMDYSAVCLRCRLVNTFDAHRFPPDSASFQKSL